MTAPLSKDLRKRLIAAVEGGQSCRSAAKRFRFTIPHQVTDLVDTTVPHFPPIRPLAGALRAVEGRFILSINDRPEVREIFDGFDLVEVSTTYSVRGRGASTAAAELLITGGGNQSNRIAKISRFGSSSDPACLACHSGEKSTGRSGRFGRTNVMGKTKCRCAQTFVARYTWPNLWQPLPPFFREKKRLSSFTS